MKTIDATVDSGTLVKQRGGLIFRIVPTVWVGIPLLLVISGLASFSLSNYSIFILNTCLLASMGALALNVQLGTTGQVSMGNSAFLAVGAFGTVIAGRAGVGWPWDVLVGAVVAALAGLIIGVPALRLKGLYLSLATIAAFFIVYFLCSQYQKNTTGEGGFTLPPVLTGPTYRYSQLSWTWLLTVILCVLVLGASLMTKGKTGRALRIIRDHQLAAPAFGVRVVRYKLLVFGLGFGIIGLQGGLAAHYLATLTINSFTLTLAISYLAMVIIGGLDSVAGAVLGAVVVTVLPALTTNLLQRGGGSSVAGPQISLIVYGLLVIVFVTSSAGGIAGWLRSSWRLLERRIAR
jgi:branched-chain amino acid transport system permease protein